jgi:hypothetical protein
MNEINISISDENNKTKIPSLSLENPKRRKKVALGRVIIKYIKKKDKNLVKFKS